MSKIKEIKLDQTNWLELNIENEEGVIIHCESFGDSDEYQELLRQRCVESKTEVTQELEATLLEQKEKRYIPTQNEIDEVNRQKLIADLTQQIESAKNELALLDWINSKYVREVQFLKSITDEEYHLKYQTEYTRMVELVTLINELEVELGGL